MDYTQFCDWLINEKCMSRRGAKDVVSRCKRVEKMTGTEEFNNDTLSNLILIESFNNSSMFIKAQLKRAVTLATKYEEIK